MRRLILPLALLAACGEDETYMTVTVDRRPTVHDAASLAVTLSNNEQLFSKTLQLAGKPFPVSFTLSAPGRNGEIGISIDALDSMATVVGRGRSTVDLDAMTATVTLDSTDFVVNTEFANDQYLTDDFEAVGFQLAAISNGQWMAAYRDECSTCDIYGRRFDSTGLPVFSGLAAGDIQFKVSTSVTSFGAMPAVAAAGTTTLAVWDYSEPTSGTRGIACRAIDATGAAAANQLSIALESTDVVSATGLAMNNNFAVTWQVLQSGTYYARGAIVTSSCALVGSLLTLSASTTSVGTFGATRPHVAANGSTVLFSWITDNDLWVRTSTIGGVLGPELKLIDASVAQTIEHVRVTPWKDGFAIAVRWLSMQSDGPGKIELYRTNIMGQIQGSPIVITDQSRSDFANNRALSIAQRPDNALLVVWHVCEAGAGLCDVFGRMLRPSGAAVGEPFVIPTSTASEQVNPSVVALADSFVAAWTDSSGEAPDRSGTSVRARILFPTYDDARGVHGATCGPSAPGAPNCDPGLACALGTDTISRCYYECAGSCARGGTCSPTVDGGGMACTF